MGEEGGARVKKELGQSIPSLKIGLTLTLKRALLCSSRVVRTPVRCRDSLRVMVKRS